MTIVISNPEAWGYVPSFLDERDPRGAREQFNANYQGGWRPFPGFKFDPVKVVLTYPGDPAMRCLGLMQFRNELILLFEGEWVAVVQKDKSWEVCRMD